MSPAGSPVERDAAARRAAQLVFSRPLAVEAGAGTGKTAVLVSRIAAWCLGPGWEEAAGELPEGAPPPEIAGRVLDCVVAITFTEDAAAEMAARVAAGLRALEAWDGGGELPGELPGLLREALPADPGTVRERARELLVQIERLRVSTIHAFAGALLARYPVEAGVHPAFAVDADGSVVQELVERAASELLARAYADGDADALELAAAGLGPLEITEAARVLVERGVPAAVLREDPFSAERVEELLGELRRRIEGCRPELAALAAISDRRATRDPEAAGFLLEVLKAVAPGGDGPLERLAALERTFAAGWLLVVARLKGWARGRDKDFTRAARKALDGGEDAFSEKVARLLPLLRVAAGLDPAAFGRLRRVLAGILGRVEAEKRRRGVVVFQDLLVRARELLEREAWVQRELQGEIRQLLVDEMQDTDPEQARIVRLLAFGEGARRRPCLFLVGDPKQSIYGWRSADLAVYEALVAEIEDAGGERHELVVNFRSVPAVLDEVERLVRPSMVEEPGLQPPFVALEPCGRLAGDPGFTGEAPRRRPVEHWAIVGTGEKGDAPDLEKDLSADEAARLEAEAVARDIASLRRAGEPLAEMAVLMRSRGRLPVLLRALRERGIPYVVGRDRSFFRSREVVEATALLRVVLDPHDPLALAAVLRSPLAGVPDAALTPLWREGLPGLTAELPGGDGAALEAAVRRAAARVEALDLDGIRGLEGLRRWPQALLAFLGTVGRLRASWREDPPDLFLERLRETTLLEPLAAARFPGAHRLANVERFLRSLEERLLGGATAGELLRWLRRVSRERPDEESGRPREAAGEAVRVLTIHGAKGLEFSHVWLVQTHAGSRRGSGADTDAGRLESGGTARWELSLAGHPTPGYHLLAEHRQRVAAAEEVRLLYVALTRARRRVVTTGLWKPGGGAAGPLLEMLRRRDRLREETAGTWPRLSELARVLAEEPDGRLERDGALWGLPTLAAFSAGMEAAEGEGKARGTAAGKAAADEARLAELRGAARARQERPWIGKMSAEAHRRLAELVAAAAEGTETPEEEALHRPGECPRVAAAVGSAVHRILERFDHAAPDPEVELDRRRREAAAWLGTALAPGSLPEARSRLDGILAAFRSGPLWERWLALEGRILARELPVLLAPPEDPGTPGDPVGVLSGVVDLLYRDPAHGALVVADFKTDDPTHVEERAEAYAFQLAHYARALQEALALDTPPRTELWFLAAGYIVPGGDPASVAP